MAKNCKKILILFSVLFSFCLVLPIMAQAATLYLEPSTAFHQVGETFIQEVRINLEPNEVINVVEVNLQYPANLLEVKDISFGNSILTLIPEKPKISLVPCETYGSCGLISFGGGIIGGYTGKISGDPGLSNLIAKIIFHSLSEGVAKINFQDDSRVLLNDGYGTLAKLTAKNSTIELKAPYLEYSPYIEKDEWKKEKENDKIPPEPFTPEIIEIDGKYYLIFSTTDKQTGIDYYEVKEIRKKDETTLNWKKAESPYLLEDQSLKSIIKVKAVDKAGNVREEIIFPFKKVNYSLIAVLILITLIVLIYFFLVIFKKLFNLKV
jgi:hypothetical protein